MAFEELKNSKYEIKDQGYGFTLSIPAIKNWLIILTLGFFLIFWAVGEIIFIVEMIDWVKSFKPEDTKLFTSSEGLPPLFMFAFIVLIVITWVSIWTIGGYFIVFKILWQFKGVEELTFSIKSITFINKLPIRTRSKEYSLSDVSSLRVFNNKYPLPFSIRWNPLISTNIGLTFNNRSEIVLFGAGLEESETQEIFEVIQKRFPKLIKNN